MLTLYFSGQRWIIYSRSSRAQSILLTFCCQGNNLDFFPLLLKGQISDGKSHKAQGIFKIEIALFQQQIKN
jgi:hypothetical protein